MLCIAVYNGNGVASQYFMKLHNILMSPSYHQYCHNQCFIYIIHIVTCNHCYFNNISRNPLISLQNMIIHEHFHTFIISQSRTSVCVINLQISKSYQECQVPMGWTSNCFTHIVKFLFVNENSILIQMSLKFVPRSPINIKPAMIQIIPLLQTINTSLSEPVLPQFTNAFMPSFSLNYLNKYKKYFQLTRSVRV